MSKANLTKTINSDNAKPVVATTAKPHKDFPLTAHRNGQWCKKVRGQIHYFGPLSDPDAALRRWLDEKDDLLAGRKPRRGRQGQEVADLVFRFLDSKKKLVESGELNPRTWGEYYDVGQIVVSTFGRRRLVEDLAGDDFEKLRAKWAGLAPVTVSKRVQMVRTMMGYAWREGRIERPVRFGTGFAKPSRNAMRLARHAAGSKMIEAEDIQKLLKLASVQLRAMILLAMNCGLGNSDLANLPFSAIDFKRGWLNFPRSKTGIGRRCPLWPKTIRAIKAAMAERPDPKTPEDDRLVFLTRTGKPWVRVTPREKGAAMVVDSITLEFGKLLKAKNLKRPGLSFYSLRHVHRTVADGSGDRTACDAIMGHAADPGDMAANYIERIDDERLQAVADHVRNWLFK